MISALPDIAVPSLADDPSVKDVIGGVLAVSVRAIVEHDPGTRNGADPEDLHEFRVATRRLRSDLSTFASVLEPAWTQGLRDDLRWLGGAAGRVRDADVLADRLTARFSGHHGADARAAALLVRRLDRERRTARSALLVAMGSERYAILISDLVDAIREPRCMTTVAVDASADDARAVVAGLVAVRWRRLRRRAEAVDQDASDDALHDVRIAAKRCRYAAEAAALIWGRPAQRFADALRGVQQVLGAHHDTVVAEAWLRAGAAALPNSGVVAGIAIAHVQMERQSSRAAFAAAWEAARRRRLRSWLR